MTDYSIADRAELLHVGSIKQVILGAYLPGTVDPDGTSFPSSLEYYDNPD